jgi:hypothetical protein
MPKIAPTVPIPVISNYEKLFDEDCEGRATYIRLMEPDIAFTPSEEDWAKMKASYGHKLPADVRKHICDLMLVYLYFVRTEEVAATVLSAKKRIEKIKELAEEPDIVLAELMAPIIAASDDALGKLNDPENHGPPKGELWNAWVRRISALLDKRGLPTGARKDDRVSPFVALVQQLQQYIPEQYRQGDHSPVALAKAIGKARSGLVGTQ